MTIQEIEKYRAEQDALYLVRKVALKEKLRKRKYFLLRVAKLYHHDKLSLGAIGKMYGISRQRVHQIVKKFDSLSVGLLISVEKMDTK